jgi:hypothetical protein
MFPLWFPIPGEEYAVFAAVVAARSEMNPLTPGFGIIVRSTPSGRTDFYVGC